MKAARFRKNLIARPARRMAAPRYPARLEVVDRPDLLLRHQPRAWLDPRVASAAAALLMAVGQAGCQPQSAGPSPNVTGSRPEVARPTAPLFIHGDGRGVVGCVVTAPPAFISEDEARQIINEELGRAGMKFEPASPADGLPVRHDAVDPRRKVAYEYVSETDWQRSQSSEDQRPSAYDIDLRRSAENYREQLVGLRLNYFVGTFYDPSYRGDLDALSPSEFADLPYVSGTAAASPNIQKFQEQTDRQARELLRAQVRDFIDWLKAQGAL